MFKTQVNSCWTVFCLKLAMVLKDDSPCIENYQLSFLNISSFHAVLAKKFCFLCHTIGVVTLLFNVNLMTAFSWCVDEQWIWTLILDQGVYNQELSMHFVKYNGENKVFMPQTGTRQFTYSALCMTWKSRACLDAMGLYKWGCKLAKSKNMCQVCRWSNLSLTGLFSHFSGHAVLLSLVWWLMPFLVLLWVAQMFYMLKALWSESNLWIVTGLPLTLPTFLPTIMLAAIVWSEVFLSKA